MTAHLGDLIGMACTSASGIQVAPTGGNIVNLADAGAIFDLQWNPFTAETQEALGKLMPGYGKVGNPTDLTSAATGDQDGLV